jgi:hypothetical protein
MKLKLTWPAGIIISIAAFVIFILYFVFKVTFLPEYDHHLVSEDYYKDELNYQQDINKLNNAQLLIEDVTIKKVTEGLQIIFPSNFDYKNIKGSIKFMRMSNDKIDFSFPIELTSNKFLIKDESLVEGRWNVRIDWAINDKQYLFKQKLTY